MDKPFDGNPELRLTRMVKAAVRHLHATHPAGELRPAIRDALDGFARTDVELSRLVPDLGLRMTLARNAIEQVFAETPEPREVALRKMKTLCDSAVESGYFENQPEEFY